MRGLNEALRAIRSAKSIAISGHLNPDGDSLGSLLSLGLGLETIGKKIYMLYQGEVPPTYQSLPGIRKLRRAMRGSVDLAIAVDCGARELLGRHRSVFNTAKETLEIDHHEYRRSFCRLQLVDARAAAVGELIYLILSALKVSFSPAIAENVLTSVIVETNLFKLSYVRPFTFFVCAELLKTRISFARLVDKVYGPKTKKEALLSALCISRSVFLEKGRLVWSIIKKEDFKRLKAKNYDVDAVASEMCAIRGVEVALLFREETPGELRVSLRSKGDVNIATVAESFGGGGHFDIAGCYILYRKKTIEKLIEAAGRQLPFLKTTRGNNGNS
ncbi:MAG: DHH family phosphoesterase [Candidatus Omnitrophica bacterium]|nr:DHH family phosphoesterase [Candidatus Omnitrophota bacterium]